MPLSFVNLYWHGKVFAAQKELRCQVGIGRLCNIP